MHKEQIDFCKYVSKKFPKYFLNKKVLDVGSLDINGSNKIFFRNSKYIGLDIGPGKNVDIVGFAHKHKDFYDVIISTEMLEHDLYYKKSLLTILDNLKNDGLLVMTWAAPGRAEHGTIKVAKNTSPLTVNMGEEWANYYNPISMIEFNDIMDINNNFKYYSFIVNNQHHDIYFYGIKK